MTSLLFFVLYIPFSFLILSLFLLWRKITSFHIISIIALGACFVIQYSQMVVDVTMTYIIFHSFLLLVLLVSPLINSSSDASAVGAFDVLSVSSFDAVSAASLFFFSYFHFNSSSSNMLFTAMSSSSFSFIFASFLTM